MTFCGMVSTFSNSGLDETSQNPQQPDSEGKSFNQLIVFVAQARLWLQRGSTSLRLLSDHVTFAMTGRRIPSCSLQTAVKSDLSPAVIPQQHQVNQSACIRRLQHTANDAVAASIGRARTRGE